MSEQPNLGYLFYKDYYAGINNLEFDAEESFFREKNRNLISANISYQPIKSDVLQSSPAPFELSTVYPGLLIGSGYAHETGAMGEFKIGFYFDHTSGLPVIPGSSIKGAFRAIFPGFNEEEFEAGFDAKRLKGNTDERRCEALKQKLKKASFCWWFIRKSEAMKEILPAYTADRQVNDEIDHKTLTFIYLLEQAIFEGTDKGIYQRDIFHDAILIPPHNNIAVLGTDFITPHKCESNPALAPFIDPVPIQFIKIMPGISFRFSFNLKDEFGEPLKGITAKMKSDLFRFILQTNGLGAKTNVGYGQFYNDKPVMIYEPPIQKKRNMEPENYTGKLKSGEILQAIVLNKARKEVQIILNGEKHTVKINNCPDEDGVLIKVAFGTITKKGMIIDVSYKGVEVQ